MLNSIFGLDSVQAIAAPVLEGPEVVRVVLNSSSSSPRAWGSGGCARALC